MDGLRLVACAVLLSCAACSSTATRASPRVATTDTSTTTVPSPSSADIRVDLARARAVTALGDSVPYGTACECSPYPQLSAADIAHVAGHPVSVKNDAVPGYTTNNVVNDLGDDTTVRNDVAGSDVVMVEIGANDVSYNSTCGTNVTCYDADLPTIAQNLTTIVERIRTLARDQDAAVILLDYWSVWLGGQYEKAKGPAYVTAADTVTAHVDETIKSVAHAMGGVYVDLRTAFRGPDASWDETHLLAPDGDHPNAAGHRRIAQTIALTASTR